MSTISLTSGARQKKKPDDSLPSHRVLHSMEFFSRISRHAGGSEKIMGLSDFCHEHNFCGAWWEYLRRQWGSPWMLRWGRLFLLFIAMFTAGTIVHFTHVSFDGPILLTVILSWALGLIASIRTTRVYSARALGLLGSVLGDIVIYCGFLLGIYELSRVSLPGAEFTLPAQDLVLDYGRGAFAVAAPLFAFGLIMAWYKDRKARIAYCGTDETCHQWWRDRRKDRANTETIYPPDVAGDHRAEPMDEF